MLCVDKGEYMFRWIDCHETGVPNTRAPSWDMRPVFMPLIIPRG